jgi:hypothetical protein
MCSAHTYCTIGEPFYHNIQILPCKSYVMYILYQRYINPPAFARDPRLKETFSSRTEKKLSHPRLVNPPAFAREAKHQNEHDHGMHITPVAETRQPAGRFKLFFLQSWLDNHTNQIVALLSLEMVIGRSDRWLKEKRPKNQKRDQKQNNQPFPTEKTHPSWPFGWFIVVYAFRLSRSNENMLNKWHVHHGRVGRGGRTAAKTLSWILVETCYENIKF